MTLKELIEQISLKKSVLCIGLDTDINKLPPHLKHKKNGIFEFNCRIIDATQPYTVAFKPNIAFYECLGPEGWQQLKLTIEYIRAHYPGIFLIADAKRGDIGNTSEKYAETFFKYFDFDAVTVSPYMGTDSVAPFLRYKDKWIILLALTSNEGADDFQMASTARQEKLFEMVLKTAVRWGTPENMMFVIGATKASLLVKVREIVPNHFLLIPGVGSQGGSLDDVMKYGLTSNFGLLVNSSRAVIFADSSTKFAETAGQKAADLQIQMEKLLKEAELLK